MAGVSRGINKVILIGNLGQDPEVRYMPSGGAVVDVRLASTEQWNDRESGERKSRTEWHTVTFFRGLAEIVGEHMKKGDAMYVEGSLRTEKWQDKNGNDRYTTKIVAREMNMLGRSDDAGGGGGGGQRRESSAPKQSDSPPQDSGGDDFDDDIPF